MRRHRAVRNVIACSIVLTTLGALSACTPTTESSGVVVVKFWARADDTGVKPEIALFNKTHKDIKVVVTPVDQGQYLTKFANALRSGSVPDLISFDIVNAPLLAAQGSLEDLTSKLASLTNASDLVPGAVQAGEYDGKSYSVPASMVSSQMFWNKALFTQAGLDPDKAPTSLAEVKADAEKIEALGGGVSGFSALGDEGQAYTGFPSVWADGGKVFTKPGADQKATFSDTKSMLSWYADMWKSGLIAATDQPNQDPGNVGLQNITAGKVGIIFTGTWAFAGFENDFGSAAGIPGTDTGSLSSFVGGNQAGIPTGAKQSDAAWTVLKWMLTNEGASKVIAKQGFISPDLAVAKKLAKGDAWSEALVKSFENGQLPLAVAYNAVINDTNGPWTQASQAIIFQGADIDSTLGTAQTKANSLIADANSQLSD